MNLFTKTLLFLLLISGWSISSHAQAADFTASPTSGCAPLLVTFTNTSTDKANIVKYDWDFGDTKTSVLENPSTTYDEGGVYTVTLTVTKRAGGTTTKKVTITVYKSPKATYTSTPLSGCPCTLVTFTNTSTANAPGAYTSKWSFGDGSTDGSNNTTHTYCLPGTYNVALLVENSSKCQNSRVDTAKVVIHEAPKIAFTSSKTNLCKVPDTVLFASSPSGGRAPYTYSWDFGDGSPKSTDANPKHGYAGTGTFTVKLKLTDANGCTDSMTALNMIKSTPMNSEFGVPKSVCVGAVTLFSNLSTPTPLSTKWLWHDGGYSTGSTATHGYLEGGTFKVIMIDSFGPGCIDTAIHNYTVYPKPKSSFVYSPTYPCPAPATITFTNGSTGADSSFWYFDDGTPVSNTKSPIHTYWTNDIFTVYLVTKSSMGCLDTFRVRDTSKPFPQGYPNPYYDSSNSPIIIRVYDAGIQFKYDSSAGCMPMRLNPTMQLRTHVWLPWGDKGTKKVSKPFYPSPPYWETYSTIDPYPDPFYDAYFPYDPSFPDYDIATPMRLRYEHGIAHIYPYKIATYNWDFGDGYTSTADSPVHSYTVEGEYWVKLTVTTTNGCSFTDSFMAAAGKHPLADFTITPPSICNHDSISVHNQSHGGKSYTWVFGDGGTYTSADSAVTFPYQYNHADTFMILLSALRYGCRDTMGIPVIVNPPEMQPEVTYSCDTPLLVKFKDASNGATTLTWHFGDGATSTDRNPVHTYASTGVYVAYLVGHNATYGCSDSIYFAVNLFHPLPTFTALDTTICLGDSVHLVGSTSSDFNTYSWRIDSSFLRDTLSSVAYRFADTGKFTVTYITQSEHQCLDSSVRKAYITVGKPQIRFKGNPLIGCAPALITLIDSSFDTRGVSISSKTWHYGDGTPDSVNNARSSRHTYLAGAYTATLYVTDNIGCTDSATLAIESRKPHADFTSMVDTFACLYSDVKFNNFSTGTGLTYKWDFGDGGTSTDAAPKHAFTTIRSFDIKLVVTDDVGCQDSIIKRAYIKTTKPTAAFTMSDSIALCKPLFVSYTNNSTGAISYFWDFGNGGTSVIPNPAYPFADTGKYTVMLVATDKYGCTDTARAVAKVFGYDGALKYTPTSGCVPLTVSFEAELINAEIMVWDFADGTTENAVDNPKTTHTYVTPGAYLPRLILGDGKGCSTSSRGLDTIRVDGITPIIEHTAACINAEVTFNDASTSPFSGYGSSRWTFDDSTVSTDKQPKKTYTAKGTYTVSLVSTNTNGCTDSTTMEITVLDRPTIKGCDTIICLHDGTVLAADGGVSYTWMPDPTLSCTNCNNPVATPSTKTNYIVIGTDENGCQNTDTVTVDIKIKTVLVLDTAVSACAKTPLQLSVSGAYFYTWTPADYLSDTRLPNPIATINDPKTVIYTVIGTEGSCEPDTATVTVTVHPLPAVDAGPDERILSGTSVTLHGTATGAKDYLWTPPVSLTCTDCLGPIASPPKTTVYTLHGYTEFGCSDSDQVTVIVFCDQSQLFIPNTFTPNGDGQNDYFYPHGQGVSLVKSFRIYNRWGQLVYEKTNFAVNDKTQGWDGTFKGEQLNPDTFVYTLEATCDNGESVFWKGDITIIR